MPDPAPVDGADGGGGAAPDDAGRPTLLGVGRIVKPHGLRGDVIVSLTTNRHERVGVGSVLHADDGRDALWVHDLIGSVVVDGAGVELGRVRSVEANPASDLLVLEDGGLIPLRFVTGSVPGARVTVDLPDGLLDLP